MSIPPEVAEYISRMEQAVMNAKQAISVVKTENDALKAKLIELENELLKSTSKRRDEKDTTKQNRTGTFKSSFHAPAWTGINGFILSGNDINHQNDNEVGADDLQEEVDKESEKALEKAMKSTLTGRSLRVLTMQPKCVADKHLPAVTTKRKGTKARIPSNRKKKTKAMIVEEEQDLITTEIREEDLFGDDSSSESDTEARFTAIQDCGVDLDLDLASPEIIPEIDGDDNGGHGSSNEKDVQTAALILSPDENKLKNLPLVKIILSKICYNNIVPIALKLSSLCPEHISQGFMDTLIECVKIEPSLQWIDLNGRSLNLTSLYPDSILSRFKILLSLYVSIATSSSHGLQLAKSLLNCFRHRLLARSRLRRVGFSLLWILLGVGAESSTLTPGGSHAEVSKEKYFVDVDENVITSSSSVISDTSITFAKENVNDDEDDNDDVIDDEAETDCDLFSCDVIGVLEQANSPGGSVSAAPLKSIRSSITQDASYILCLSFLTECCIRLGCIDVLYDTLFDIVATIAPRPKAAEIIAVTFAIKSAGHSCLGPYAQHICYLISSLDHGVQTDQVGHPLYTLFPDELSKLKTSFSIPFIEKGHSVNNNHFEKSLENLFLSCQNLTVGSETDALSSCMAAVTIEARGFGMLNAIIQADEIFLKLYPEVEDKIRSGGMYTSLGLKGFEYYVQKLLSISSYHSSVMTAPIDQEAWSLNGSLWQVLFQNPFPLSDTIGEYTDEYTIRKICNQHFQNHWERHLAGPFDPAAIHFSLSLHTSILKSMLIDYSGTLRGWRTGTSGRGQHLSERLAARIQQARQDMIECGLHWTSESGLRRVSACAASAMWFFNLAPVTSITSPDVLKNAANIFDIFMQSIMSTGLQEKCRNSIRSRCWDKLAFTVHEIVSLVMINLMERLIFLSESSVAGFVDAVATFRLRSITVIIPPILVYDMSRLLYIIPSPWIHMANSESFVKYLALARISDRLSQPLLMELALLLRRLSKRSPVFIINLQRRTDRWHRMLQVCDMHNLAAIRVNAVDGIMLSTGKLQGVVDSDVLYHWDSTINAKFDLSCVVDKRTVLTSSERACAMSHISVWRAIAASESGSLNELLRWHRTSGAVFSTLPSNDWKIPSEEWHLIFEDDACIMSSALLKGESFVGTVNRLLNSLPVGSGVDIIYLGRVIPKNAKISTKKTGRYFVCPNYLWQLHSYMITKKTAELLLRNLPVDCPVDNYISRLIQDGIVRAFAVREGVVIQRRQMRMRGTAGTYKKNDSDICHSGKL